jgi:hypothetical protein
MAETTLAGAIEAVALAPPANPVPPMPEMASQIFGKTYRFGPNPLHLATARLYFDSLAEGKLSLTSSDGSPPHNGAVGLDGVYRFSPGENGLPVGIRGEWTAPDTFVCEYDTVGSVDVFDMIMRFDGGRIVLFAKERTYEAGVEIEGTAEAETSL